MYLIVRAEDNVIVGTAENPVCETTCSRDGYKIFEIPDEEFEESMIGNTIGGYEKNE